MVVKARPASEQFAIAPGVIALPHGLVLLEASRVLIAADVHFGYEDVIGGALPLWSTAETLAVLVTAIARYAAREMVLLGDIVHSSRMSDGATRVVGDAMATLQTHCPTVAIAGNHEGRSRGRNVVGRTEEAIERDGWLLIHGDLPPASGVRCIIGHLHPSMRLGGGRSIPVVLGGERLIVAPALTPYSTGLDIRSDACSRAVRSFGAHVNSLSAVACGEDRVYPFGTVGSLRALTRTAL